MAVYTVRLRHPGTLALLAELEGYISLRYTRRWQAGGDFEMKIGNEHVLMPVATWRGIVIEVIRDGVYEFAGIVKHRTFSLGDDDESGMVWTLIGPDMSGLVSKVLALPAPLTTLDSSTEALGDYDVQTDIAASIAMRYYLNRNVITVGEALRVRSLIALGEQYGAVPVTTYQYTGFTTATQQYLDPETGDVTWSISGIPSFEYVTQISLGDTVTYKARWEPLIQIITEIAQRGRVGYRFRLDSSVPKVYFDVLKSADRTEGTASGFVPTVFSINNDNLASFTYEDNGLDVENTLYVAGAGVGTTRKLSIEKPDGTLYSDGRTADSWQWDWDEFNAYVARRNASVAAQQTAYENELYGSPLAESSAATLAMRALDPASQLSWGRQEAFLDVREGTTVAELSLMIDDYLAAHADLQSVSFQPLESLASRYRLDWELGDTVTVRCDQIGLRGNAAIHEVSVTLAADAEPALAIVVGQPRRDLVNVIQEQTRGAHRPQAT